MEEFLDQADRHLERQSWYGLDRFSMGDINLYTMVRVSQGFGLELGDQRVHLRSWLARLEGRDAVRRSAPHPVPEIVEHLH